MVAPLAPSRIDFLVPLLLVIVERLATLTRSIAENPGDFADSRPIFAPLANGDDAGATSDEFHIVPRLGRLNFLHTTNVGLLAAAFVLLAATSQDLVTNVLALVVAIVWIQLPLLEIDIYDDIRDVIQWPASLYAHIATGLICMIYIAGFGGFEPGLFLRTADVFQPELGLLVSNPVQATTSVLLVGIILGSSGVFLHLFEREVIEARTRTGQQGTRDGPDRGG